MEGNKSSPPNVHPERLPGGGEAEEAEKPAAQSQLVWVKVRGYPWWPAMIVSMSDVPESQRECVESGRKGTEQQLVYSFGEHIFFWVNPSRATLRPFQDPESYNEFSSKVKTPQFKQAFQECWSEKDAPGSQLAALRQSLAAVQVDKERKVGRGGGEAGEAGEADGGNGNEMSRHAESKAKSKGGGVEGAGGKVNLTKSPEENNNKEIADFEDELRNHDYCDTCGDTGGLVCCDGCPNTYHVACLGFEGADELPEPWFCSECVEIRRSGKPTPFELVARGEGVAGLLPAVAGLGLKAHEWERDAGWGVDVDVVTSEEEDEEAGLEIEIGDEGMAQESLDVVIEKEDSDEDDDSGDESRSSSSSSSSSDDDSGSRNMSGSDARQPKARASVQEIDDDDDDDDDDAQALYAKEQELLKASSVICVCDLRCECVEASELIQVFGKHGNLIFAPDIRVNKQCAYLSYCEPREAQRAVNSEQGTVLGGRTIFVKKVIEVPARDDKDEPASEREALPKRSSTIFNLSIGSRGAVEGLLRQLPKMVWDAARENMARRERVTREFLEACSGLDGMLSRARQKVEESMEPLMKDFLGEQRDVIKTRLKQQQQQLKQEYEKERAQLAAHNLRQMEEIMHSTQRSMHQLGVPCFFPTKNAGEIEEQEIILDLINQSGDPHGGQWGVGAGAVYGGYRDVDMGYGGYQGGAGEWEYQQHQQGWSQHQGHYHHAAGGFDEEVGMGHQQAAGGGGCGNQNSSHSVESGDAHGHGGQASLSLSEGRELGLHGSSSSSTHPQSRPSKFVWGNKSKTTTASAMAEGGGGAGLGGAEDGHAMQRQIPMQETSRSDGAAILGTDACVREDNRDAMIGNGSVEGGVFSSLPREQGQASTANSSQVPTAADDVVKDVQGLLDELDSMLPPGI